MWQTYRFVLAQDSAFVTRLAGAIESGGEQVSIDTAGIEDTEVFPLV